MRIKRAFRAFFTILLGFEYVYADETCTNVFATPTKAIEQINRIIELANDGINQVKVLEEAENIIKTT